MSLDVIFLIILATLYFLALLITFLLALFYNIKHKPFVVINKTFQKEVIDAWKKYDIDILPKPIKNIYETKSGEEIFLVKKYLIDISNKNKKQMKNNVSDLQNNIYGVFKNNYKLFGKSEKEFFKEQIVYLSNKRMIIESKGEFIKVKLPEILVCQFAILGYAQTYKKILLIETTKLRFKFIIEDLQLGFFVTQFIKKGF